jgi:tRNA dimethylallyltransferase
MAKRASESDPVRSRDTPVPATPAIHRDDKSVVTPYYICGPTASGKSSLALETARRLDGEIVNADAFQLYRGLEIVCAAPFADELATVRHHLYGVLDPTAHADAQRYVELARPVIADILSRGKTPVITGGSGLYLKFLTHGAAPLPTGDATLRNEMDKKPLEDLVAELERLDPVEASRTALQNRRFVSRAVEICILSGQKASDLRDRWESQTAEISSRLRGTVIQRTRPDLHRRIAQRTKAMLAGGALEEVAALTEVSDNLEKAIGFREIRNLLAGKTNRTTCEELINAATRQYAKRQETWFRREHWLTPSTYPTDAC